MRVLSYCCAPLLGLLLYWPGFTSWFLKDDFAWLGLYRLLPAEGLWHVLFHPYAQGTVRTISERIPFTSFVALFGIEAWPFRSLEFVTFTAVTFVLSKVCAELTGSRLAGWLAAMIWTVNGAVCISLFWSSVYYELLCCLVFLTALWLLIEYAKTGDRRLWIAQWIVFLIGFGVLEQNVVYPALATAYALCCARHLLIKVLPMFVPSALYTAAHIVAAPLASEGPYKMHWDLSVAPTLWSYFKIALGPVRLSLIGMLASKPRSFATLILAVAILGFLLYQLRQQRWISGFFAAWFVIVLAPVLPLRDHMSDYYLTIPLLGFSMLAAQGLAMAWKSGIALRVVGVVLMVVYLIPAVMVGRATAESFHRDAAQNQHIVESVVAQAHSKGASRILLSGLTPALWETLIQHRPFRLYGFDEVFLQPAERATMPAGSAYDGYVTTEEGAAAMRSDPKTLTVALQDLLPH